MLLGAATVAFAEDSYLYWMIGAGANDSQYTYDKVVVRGNTTTGGRDELYLYYSSSAPVGGTGQQYVDKTTTDAMRTDGAALYAKLASDKTYSSFVIELYNADQFIAQSETLDFSSAVANYYIATNNSMSQLAMWAPTSFAIPEPNSAMLLLLGCAALGLRRRRQLKA